MLLYWKIDHRIFSSEFRHDSTPLTTWNHAPGNTVDAVALKMVSHLSILSY